jgi:IclR family transcriptional regulator, KDG regulon repressor
MKIVTKACQLLELFLDHGDELSLEELARFSQLNKATTRRIAVALMENGFIKQTHKRGKYSLGMRFLDYSGLIKKNNRVMNAASPYLIKLSQTINESVGLALWDGMKAAVVQYFHANHLLKVVPDEGTRVSMYNSAIGKAILAQFKEDEIDRYLHEPFQQFTPNTISSPAELKNHLRIVRKEGVAYDDEEFAEGVRSVGVVIKTRSGELVGAINIMGPSVRLSRERLREMVPLLKNCALDISKEF